MTGVFGVTLVSGYGWLVNSIKMCVFDDMQHEGPARNEETTASTVVTSAVEREREREREREICSCE